MEQVQGTKFFFVAREKLFVHQAIAISKEYLKYGSIAPKPWFPPAKTLGVDTSVAATDEKYLFIFYFYKMMKLISTAATLQQQHSHSNTIQMKLNV